ncbi:amino acid ABC transporter substrate-binding protein [Rhodospirillum rubrum]|uniref:Extracellular solute-binding protein, family 3 n=1 Tax=Rhodospirillum rubrum (strain ATCC 11170 / ATH 1.1.1 / DSM 467 / LMG 4362 / NCIMB 8255 / S1) TaxID=269796 RepID=Q2RWB2_RHORT|nr:amino acid ABC transporter substrate-binding protein [Rhodospirillum rubrum]ABC21583.1 extracellular solute-binding protein, family 3 [Rhodospirillum rubrum ATCC 11170]AEO47269.1 extracellular solute-binding protein [Rhodospirillum rubrum F11]MBK5955805.1 amino acid ABC transporter substrate-binding protein [Rhodospirillum rubrum]QXG81253.1 amino acid ABC transporter substrate-binding protein [Rhodospirillum rubrum]HAP99936.1 amino acid ABC transporter substrate-binding protein [Rhodospiril
MVKQLKKIAFKAQAAGLAAALALCGLGFSSSAEAGETLDAIKARGVIKIGVGGNSPGFSAPDSAGRWQGFFIDIGRALAVTVFNDPEKAEFVNSSPQQRLPALQSGEFDILLSGVTQTITRATKLGFHFGPVVFYDGQGLLVPKKLGITKGSELDGATVCVQTGTTGELNIADFFRQHKISFKPVVIEESNEFLKAFASGRCDVLTQDSSDLAIRRTLLPNAADYVLLPERISKEPLAPAIRYGDDRWLEIVNWTVYALIEAEELGITQATIDSFLGSDNPSIRRFLGVDPSLAEATGLDAKFAYNIIKALGNYGEVFERSVGKASKLGFERGYNQPWTQGGLLYSPPFR